MIYVQKLYNFYFVLAVYFGQHTSILKTLQIIYSTQITFFNPFLCEMWLLFYLKEMKMQEKTFNHVKIKLIYKKLKKRHNHKIFRNTSNTF